MRHLGAALIAMVVLGLLALFFGLVPANSAPSEDACMLFLYAENFADSGVITYNAGTPPVEGGTDFLWMIALSGLYAIGCNTYLAATCLSALALLGSAHLLARLAGYRTWTATGLFSLMLLAMPQLFAAVQGFSPMVFGFFLILALFAYVRERPVLMLATLLVTCLIRPDGVVFAGPLIMVHTLSHLHNLRTSVRQVALVFLLPGLVYFAWRFHYFGYFLPLPFYVKSNFQRVALLFSAESLKTNGFFIVALAPALIVIATTARFTGAANRRRLFLALGALTAVPWLFYSCMKLEQNIAYRFQYPMLVLTIGIAASLFPSAKKRWLFPLSVLSCLVMLSPLYGISGLRTLGMPFENVPYIAQALGAIEGKGKLAITEAGRLAYYTRWHTVDLWGLNTADLSRTLVTPDYIRALHPDLIVLHPEQNDHGDDYGFVEDAHVPAHTERSWQHMAQNTYLGADPEQYDRFMVPHSRRESCRGALCTAAGLRSWLVKTMRYRGTFPVYYMFLVAKDSPLRVQIQQVITRHGGIDYTAYRGLRAAFAAE